MGMGNRTGGMAIRHGHGLSTIQRDFHLSLPLSLSVSFSARTRLGTCTRSSCLWPATLDIRYHRQSTRHAVARNHFGHIWTFLSLSLSFPSSFSAFFLCFSVFFSSVFRFLCDDLWICMNCADEVLCKVHAAIEFIWFGIYCCSSPFVLHCRYTFWRLPPRCASLNWVRAGWSSNSEEFCKLDKVVWLVC